MSAKKISDIEFNKEEKINNNKKQNNSQIKRYSKDFMKQNIKEENKINELNHKKEKVNSYSFKNLFDKSEIEIIKEKLKENLDSNLTSYIISTKSREQKIIELLELINQYESQIASLNNQIIFLTNNNKQMKENLKNTELNYTQTKNELIKQKEINEKNNTNITVLQKDKNICEKKMKELVNIINQYSFQIEALTETLNNIKQEFTLFKKQNENDKIKIKELTDINILIKKEKDELNIINKQLNEENTILKQDKENLSEKNILLENNNEILNEEKNILEKNLEKEKNKLNNLINDINQDLSSLTDYFENKINSIINKDINNISILNENKLTLNCFQNIEDNNEIKKINFELFIKAIIKGFNSFKEKMNNKNNMENTDNINKLLKIKDENIIKLKEDIKKLIQDNIKLIKELQKVPNDILNNKINISH